MTSDYTRQLDLLDPSKVKTPLTIIGAGSVGSFTALSLAKMGIQDITVYDGDTVEEHNIPNQFYRMEDIGRPKVAALLDIVYEFTGVEIKPVNELYKDQELKGIVISAVDSMKARKLIWRRLKGIPGVDLYIDARMGAEVGKLYSICPIQDVKLYQQSLHAAKEALHEPCTRRTIVYTVLGISAYICGHVKKFLAGESIKKELTIDFKLGMIIPQ